MSVGTGADSRKPLQLLSPMERRGIDIDENTGARCFGLRNGFVVPDVFTNCECYRDAVNRDDAGLAAGGKIPFFIKHLIIRQALLVVLRHQRSLINHTCTVEQRLAAQLRIANNNRQLGW